MNRSARACAAVSLPLVLAAVAAPVQAHDSDRRPGSYRLTGDPEGSKFEGIGVDRAQRTFYVSEVTGGEIHRGDIGDRRTQEWKPAGADGRFTARGITTDKQDRVYIAGGPNGIGQPDRPDLWVYNQAGVLLASLRVGVENAFLNDVAIGPDGAAYFTNSNSPQIFRLAKEAGDWKVSVWADATGVIGTKEGFNLGGIVVSPDRRSLVVAQGNTGILWRFDLRTAEVSRIDSGSVDLHNADGLVLRGHTLWVVRNFDHVLVKLHLDGRARSASLASQTRTAPSRVFTTAKLARGRLLLVDSKFDETVAEPPYQVIDKRPSR
jgi:sugar lactone lactonase YvrE